MDALTTIILSKLISLEYQCMQLQNDLIKESILLDIRIAMDFIKRSKFKHIECKNLQRNGSCMYGSSCWFKHDNSKEYKSQTNNVNLNNDNNIIQNENLLNLKDQQNINVNQNQNGSQQFIKQTNDVHVNLGNFIQDTRVPQTQKEIIKPIQTQQNNRKILLNNKNNNKNNNNKINNKNINRSHNKYDNKVSNYCTRTISTHKGWLINKIKPNIKILNEKHYSNLCNRYKKPICINYLNGKCIYGCKCNYFHPPKCNKQNCELGDECSHAHIHKKYKKKDNTTNNNSNKNNIIKLKNTKINNKNKIETIIPNNNTKINTTNNNNKNTDEKQNNNHNNKFNTTDNSKNNDKGGLNCEDRAYFEKIFLEEILPKQRLRRISHGRGHGHGRRDRGRGRGRGHSYNISNITSITDNQSNNIINNVNDNNNISEINNLNNISDNDIISDKSSDYDHYGPNSAWANSWNFDDILNSD